MGIPDPTSVATVLALVAELKQLTPDLTRAEVVRVGIEIAQRATSSHIAYLHFLNDDQNTIELGAWSHETMSYCTAVYDRHYPVAQAGIWADSARLRKPCVHNDYEHLADRRGLPDGHSRLVRHLGLPVIDEGAVRMLIGVGNKDTDYTDTDVELLDVVATRIWSVLKQRDLYEQFIDLRTQFRALKQVASASSFTYDVDEDALRCDGFFTTLLDAPESPKTLDGLLEYVSRIDRERVAEALRGQGGSRHTWWMHCRRDSGQVFLAELKLQFRQREIGTGLVVAGTIQDLSERLVAQQRTGRDDRDFITGLPNQAGLSRQVQQTLRRRATRQPMVLYALEVVLPGTHASRQAPMLRDEVLRVCARRLEQAVGAHDLVACVADGVFEVMQFDVHSPLEAEAVARRLVAELARPIEAMGHATRLQVAAGVSLDLGGIGAFRDVRIASERALYRALQQGDHAIVVETLPA